MINFTSKYVKLMRY